MNVKLIFGILILTTWGCSGDKDQGNTGEADNGKTSQITLTPDQVKNAGLQYGGIEERELSSELKANGYIEVPPQNVVSVSMPLGGYLKSTHLLPGLHVTKGEVLAIMEDQQYIQLQQDYLSCKARLRYAEAEYTRQHDLNVTKSSSDKNLQQAQLEYETQKIALSALAQKLRLIMIDPDNLNDGNIRKSVSLYSPISGFVSAVKVNIGKYVNPSDILFELVNPDDIHLNLKIYEKDLGKFFIGQKLFAFTNHDPDKKYPCSVILISQNLSEDNTADVHCHFDQYDRSLLPGMYMNANIQLKSFKAHCVPEKALVYFEGNNYLFIKSGPSDFTMVPVKTGITDRGFCEIPEYESLAGKQVVVSGAYALLMALKNKEE